MHASIYTPNELARLTRVSRATILAAVRAGKLAAFRTSERGDTRIHRQDAEAWLSRSYGGRKVKLDPERGMVFDDALEPVAGA
jgi:excisionase family DNA binding protein